MNLILCGLPMCGKTTLAARVADHLGWKWIDLDHCIESAYCAMQGKQMSCREIFQTEGKAAFRTMEKAQVSLLQGSSRTIVALGGGCLIDPENADLLKTVGCLLYLHCDPHRLWKRTQTRGIPAFLDPLDPEKAFYELAERRMPLYQSRADKMIDMDTLTLEEAVHVIIRNCS